MSAPAELKGPDLSKGILTSELPEGRMLLGHADGQAVLVVRRGGDVLAVSATCTHYGGPLAEGVIEGDQVRCPWHHACFNLRTGEASEPPALNPIDCWDVERTGDRVLIRSKRAPHVAAPVPPARKPAAIVIVGGGAAGALCAETLRREAYEGPITVIGDDPADPVDRPNLSKDYLAGTAPEEWMPLRGKDFYRDQGISFETGSRAVTVAHAPGFVHLADGRAVGYDALLLATGAEPIRLAIPGAELAHVHTLRTLADSRAIVASAAGKQRVVVLGASFIALEAAAALRTRGLEVHVVAPDKVPMERVLGPEVGSLVRTLHEEKGVVFHLGEKPREIRAGSVELESGASVPADLVVMGVGVRPRTALAEQAGCRIDRGVVVDAQLETSVPGIYAAGDIARFPDWFSGQSIRVEHWVFAERQGRAAARSMLGQRQPFAAVPFFWSAHYDLQISYVGHAEKWTRLDIRGDLAARDATIAYRDGERILAVATIGRDKVSLEVEVAMEKRDLHALEALVAG